MATPFEPVIAVVILEPLSAKVPLAALGTPADETVNAGAVNVTTRLLTAFPLPSSTVTDSGVANWVPSVVLCSDPPDTEIGTGCNVFDIKKVAVDCVEGDAAITL